MAAGGLPVLYVLPPSHYCERARWALQHADVPFDEERWAVGLHVRFARRIAPTTSLPILALGDKVVQGSGAILDWAGVSGGDAELEARFERRIGVLVRSYVYARTLSRESTRIRRLLFDGVPRWQRAAGTLMWPVIRKAMIKGMDIRPELAPRIEGELDRELDWFETRLGQRGYLVGDRFGRADITAASLLSPIAGSPHLNGGKPANTNGLTHFLDRPSIVWAQRIYAEHRGTVSNG